MRDERPSHCLRHSARRQRTLGLAGADLSGSEDCFSRSAMDAERYCGHALQPEDSDKLFDKVGLAMHIRAPRRHRHRKRGAAARDTESEALKHLPHLVRVQLYPGEALDLAERKIDHVV